MSTESHTESRSGIELRSRNQSTLTSARSLTRKITARDARPDTANEEIGTTRTKCISLELPVDVGIGQERHLGYGTSNIAYS